jgi:thioredoxin 1
MNRRDFLSLTATVTLAAPFMLSPTRADAATMLEYLPGMIEARLAAGEVVMLGYHASWCGTCNVQKRVIGELQAENPDYVKKITFIHIDWDKWEKDVVTTSRNIPRRSTLVVLKGEAELGRIVSGTSKDVIRQLLDTALAAA